MSTVKTATAPAKRNKQATRVSRAKNLVKQLSKEGYSTIGLIRKLHIRGFQQKEIIQAGFNKNTTYRQVRAYEMGE